MKNKLRLFLAMPFVLVALMMSVVSAPGCKEFGQFLATFGSIIHEAGTAIDIIQAGTSLFFAANPDPTQQERVTDAINKARAALALADRAAAGASDFTKGDGNAALADFREAYADLEKLTGPFIKLPATPTAARAHIVMPPRPLAAEELK